ncbi:hypothetical protein VN0128_11950 [Helicobacter pylori]
MVRDLVVILLPIFIVGCICVAIRSTAQAFKGEYDDDDVNDGFFSRIWNKFIE